ncbi:MAG TPA: biopolymer transporter ExbD, partial [Thermoanaerobaculia bacterium]|nr:biopolymer transporter ExbD [Thermoanaerobaculia bacterium]
MQVGGSGKIKSDINVTPLVDVVLVLLIIFMVITPMLQKGVDVKLPSAGNTKERKEEGKKVTVA